MSSPTKSDIRPEISKLRSDLADLGRGNSSTVLRLSRTGEEEAGNKQDKGATFIL